MLGITAIHVLYRVYPYLVTSKVTRMNPLERMPEGEMSLEQQNEKASYEHQKEIGFTSWFHPDREKSKDQTKVDPETLH